jgi:CO/xanthine dehydrogenase Mo-binding subunit
LQPEAGVGYVDENGRITIEIAGQWTHEDQEQVAHALGLPLETRCASSTRPLAAPLAAGKICRCKLCWGWPLCACASGALRPVRIIWSREESIIGHCKRHPAYVKTKWGATKEGKITAVSAELILDSGAYAYTSTKVLGNANLMVTGPYEIPNAHVDSYAVTTNNVPGGAFRGFGGPQGAFVAESQMNKLAERWAWTRWNSAEKLPCAKAAS